VTTPVAASSVRPPRLLVLSKISFALPAGKENRSIAAWSVGVSSAALPLSKVTP
jgi:hypothetical protein